jgi:hypothetical protein
LSSPPENQRYSGARESSSTLSNGLDQVIASAARRQKVCGDRIA